MFLKIDKKDIVLTLIKIKIFISQGQYEFVPRRKNMESLAELGLMPENIIDIINELTFEDYCSGPEDDRDFGEKDCIWIFGKYIDEYEIYIKLKISTDRVVTISFHKAEFSLQYPFKSEK